MALREPVLCRSGLRHHGRRPLHHRVIAGVSHIGIPTEGEGFAALARIAGEPAP